MMAKTVATQTATNVKEKNKMSAIRMTKEQQKKLDEAIAKKATMRLPRLLVTRLVADEIRKRFNNKSE